MDDEPRGPGRPSLYKPEYATQAEKLCRLGATDIDLADFFGVTTRTIERWRAQFEDFCRAVTMGKDFADDNVERSLYKKAVGYEQEAVKIMQYEGSPVVIPYREKIAPDTGAAIFWLKNRRKDQWRDRIEQETTHKFTFTEEFETFMRELKAMKSQKVVDGRLAEDGATVEVLPVPLRS